MHFRVNMSQQESTRVNTRQQGSTQVNKSKKPITQQFVLLEEAPVASQSSSKKISSKQLN